MPKIPQHQFVKSLRSNMTEAEQMLWRHLRAHRFGGNKFKRQQPIGSYVVDFVHFGKRLIIEADGGQHDSSKPDLRRDEWFREQGFTVMRFWNNEILGNPDGVLSVIADALSNPPSPLVNGGVNTHSPSPLAGEGLGERGLK